jgi:hypothetical protein
MPEISCPNCGHTLEVSPADGDGQSAVPGAGLKGHERSTLSNADWSAIKAGYKRYPPTGYTRPSAERRD